MCAAWPNRVSVAVIRSRTAGAAMGWADRIARVSESPDCCGECWLISFVRVSVAVKSLLAGAPNRIHMMTRKARIAIQPDSVSQRCRWQVLASRPRRPGRVTGGYDIAISGEPSGWVASNPKVTSAEVGKPPPSSTARLAMVRPLAVVMIASPPQAQAVRDERETRRGTPVAFG